MVRHSAMLADALLGEGGVGAIQRASGRQEFTSKPDQLFPGWPIAVLIERDSSTQFIALTLPKA